MRKKLFLLVSLLLFLSCSNSKKENIVVSESKVIEESKPLYNTYNTIDFLNSYPDFVIENIKSFFTGYKSSLFHNDITIKDVPLYSLGNDYFPKKVGSIPIGIELTVVAHLDRNFRPDDKDYFLVKTNDDLFEGWVMEDDIFFHISKGDFYLYPRIINISPDNQYLACIGFPIDKKMIIITSRSADKIIAIPIDELEVPEEYKGYYLEYNFIGWGNNNPFAWFEILMDGQSICYIIIDYAKGTYQSVPSLTSYKEIIDFDTGDCLFTDEEPILGFTDDEIEMINNQLVSIYYTNIYNPKKKVFVDNVIGNRDWFKYGPNNELLYLNENNEYVEYKPNSN